MRGFCRQVWPRHELARHANRRISVARYYLLCVSIPFGSHASQLAQISRCCRTVLVSPGHGGHDQQVTAISSKPASPGSSSEGYCDGDCIFCSTTISHTPAVVLTIVRVEVSRLEVVHTPAVNDGFLKPVYHPPQA